MEKNFITADMMEKDSWGFALDLYRRGLNFDWIMGVTRGGAQISVYIQEALLLLTKREISYATVHTCSYDGIGSAGSVKVRDMGAVLSEIAPNSSILIVDDVFDRGLTLQVVKDSLCEKLAEKDISLKLGALYFKPENNQTDIVPDFYYRTFKGKDWLVFPHELCGLSREELDRKGFPKF